MEFKEIIQFSKGRKMEENRICDNGEDVKMSYISLYTKTVLPIHCHMVALSEHSPPHCFLLRNVKINVKHTQSGFNI